jgi:phenylacetate-CoA ligase
VTKEDTDQPDRGTNATDFRPADRVLFGYALSMFVGGNPLIEALQHIRCTLIPVGPREGIPRLLNLFNDPQANSATFSPSFALYLMEQIPPILGRKQAEMGWKEMAVGGEPAGSVLAIQHRLEEEYQTDVGTPTAAARK